MACEDGRASDVIRRYFRHIHPPPMMQIAVTLRISVKTDIAQIIIFELH